MLSCVTCWRILPEAGAMRNGSLSARETWAHRTGAIESSSLLTETGDDSTDSAPSSIAPWPADGSGAPMWPTATAATTNDSEDPISWLERRERNASKLEGATRASMPLTIAIKVWQARRDAAATWHPSTTLLDAVREWAARRSTWATPTASDSKRGRAEPRDRTTGDRHSTLSNDVHEWASRRAPTTIPDGTRGSRAVYLNPEFAEALLGFPIGWTDSGRPVTVSLPW